MTQQEHTVLNAVEAEIDSVRKRIGDTTAKIEALQINLEADKKLEQEWLQTYDLLRNKYHL